MVPWSRLGPAPQALGNVLDWFATRQMAYTALFFAAAATYTLSAAMLPFVRPHESTAAAATRTVADDVAPAGARLCDRHCFRHKTSRRSRYSL